MRVIYSCEICGKEYSDEERCKHCEETCRETDTVTLYVGKDGAYGIFASEVKVDGVVVGGGCHSSETFSLRAGSFVEIKGYKNGGFILTNRI